VNRRRRDGTTAARRSNPRCDRRRHATARARPSHGGPALTALAVLMVATASVTAACGGTKRASGPPPTGAAPVPCSATAMVAALQARYGPKVRIVYNHHLTCAGRLAEIAVMVDNLESDRPGYSGPVGSPHGALMEYSGGSWHEVDLSQPNRYCTPDGRRKAAVPAALGVVCGIQ